ncbi:MAG: ABC transporter ATP-binding protein [Campylobacterales bacterium]|nr:ABC transporter ATP-binding protein [Campylobacterales bacterium]
MIKIKDANRYFYKGEEREVHALRDINLELKEGEFALLSGPSGCGKTTLLNAVGALDRIDSGEIWLDNQEIGSLSEEKRVKIRLESMGFVFQAYNLIPVLSVRENIGFIMQLRGFSQSEIDKRVKELAELLEIDKRLDSLPSTLSGGQQQRVAVARAVAAKPKIILADEPTANLDSKNSHSLMEMMRSLNEKEGVSILFASHDPYVTQSVRRIIHMSDGAIVAG